MLIFLNFQPHSESLCVYLPPNSNRMKYLVIIVSILACSFTFHTTYFETGRASFYANKFSGRKTTSGEIFSQDGLTAAHKTLKLGTFVLVKNLMNDSTVVVKINDRLGKTSHHNIDLSLRAAKQLNFIKQGNVKVTIETIE